jgi:hypothetical protein
MRIQKAIQEGHLKFDNKMKLDGHPFPQNMVGFSVNMVIIEEKGKTKVLTSARAKQGGSADPTRQVTLEQVRTMCGSRTGGWSLPCVMSD